MSIEKILTDLFVDGKIESSSISNVDGLFLSLSSVDNRTISYVTNVQARNRLEINNVDNTHDVDKIVLSSSKLTTQRLINNVPFDGTADITINAVDLTDRIAVSEKASPFGVATLDGCGIILTTQLPSYIDDVLEFDDLVSFPAIGESGKIYLAKDTNKTYRWGGSSYIYITSGAVDSVFGRTGVIIAASGDYNTGLVTEITDKRYQTDNQKLFNDATSSIQTQLDSKQISLVSGTNIKTINGVTLLGSGNLLTPDMDTTSPQDVSGLKTFLAGKLGLRNVANTFTSFFMNANTSSIVYTLQNRNGILADNIDLALKQDISNQDEIGTSQDAQVAWHGKTIIFTTNCTITIPATLPNSYIFNGITLAGVTVTWSITSPKTWLFGSPSPTTEKQIFTLTQRGSTNSILLLGV